MQQCICATAALLFSLVTMSSSVAASDTDASSTAEEFAGTLSREGNVVISGQPTEEGLDIARSMGVGTIVSLRTPEEVEDEPDHAELAASRGLKFVSIPSGGPDHPFSPADVDRFAEVMANAKGDVLLHCRSGTRATHLWVAWLVRHQGVPFEEALARGRDIQFGAMPIEGYLKGEVDYSFTPKSDKATPAGDQQQQ